MKPYYCSAGTVIDVWLFITKHNTKSSEIPLDIIHAERIKNTALKCITKKCRFTIRRVSCRPICKVGASTNSLVVNQVIYFYNLVNLD